jgi:hypothetical protein
MGNNLLKFLPWGAGDPTPPTTPPPPPLSRNKGEALGGEAWQKSEEHWKNRVGKGWVAKRVLGKGGQGIVGHWTYTGPDRDTKGGLVDIAVKQASIYNRGHHSRGLLDEAAMPTFLNTADARHIIRMYRQLYEE